MSTAHTKMIPVSVSKLSPKAPFAFDLQPQDQDLQRIQDGLGLLGLRKLRFSGEIRASGATDWELQAVLGATVVQPCVVTLDPVTTRIDEAVTRRFLTSWPDEADLGEETEMDADDSLEALGEAIDLPSIMQEALSLALPVYPRVEGAQTNRSEARPEGAAPIRSIDENAFSALSDLKRKLEDNGD
ncbi:MAG: DUF177 domain-containing protein [Pseudomonadota bacterium]